MPINQISGCQGVIWGLATLHGNALSMYLIQITAYIRPTVGHDLPPQ